MLYPVFPPRAEIKYEGDRTCYIEAMSITREKQSKCKEDIAIKLLGINSFKCLLIIHPWTKKLPTERKWRQYRNIILYMKKDKMDRIFIFYIQHKTKYFEVPSLPV